MKIQTIQDARDYLFTRRATGMKLGLESMKDLVKRLGHPERRLPAVHLAGTNGKGSTAAIIEAILRAAGLKSGLYTSPHLTDERERLRIRGEKISETELLGHLQILLPHIEAAGASFFEILTAMAFVHFTENDVDLAVLETGLGGRLDATSVITPELSVITSIGKDHIKTLGDDLVAIAGEKAGIIKPDRPAVIGHVTPEVKTFFQKHCADKKSALYFTDDAVKIEALRLSEHGSNFHCQTLDSTYSNLHLRLVGRHQVSNAATALMAVDLLRRRGFHIPDNAVREGLAHVRWPARLERISEKPTIVIDSAHNPMGTQALAEAIASLFTYDRLILVFGVLADKHYETMLGHLAPLADGFVFTQPMSDRALDPETLKTHRLVQGKAAISEADIETAWAKARSLAGENDLIVAAGSMYFVGEILKIEGRAHPQLIP